MCPGKKVKSTALESLEEDKKFKAHLALMEDLYAQEEEELQFLEEDSPLELEWFPDSGGAMGLTPAQGDSMVITSFLYEDFFSIPSSVPFHDERAESETESETSLPRLTLGSVDEIGGAHDDGNESVQSEEMPDLEAVRLAADLEDTSVLEENDF